MLHHAVNAVALDPGHVHREETVVEQDARSGRDILSQGVVGRRDLPGDRRLLGREYHVSARFERHRRPKPAHADAGALEVHQDAYEALSGRCGAAHAPDPLAPLGGVAV